MPKSLQKADDEGEDEDPERHAKDSALSKEKQDKTRQDKAMGYAAPIIFFQPILSPRLKWSAPLSLPLALPLDLAEAKLYSLFSLLRRLLLLPSCTFEKTP